MPGRMPGIPLSMAPPALVAGLTEIAGLDGGLLLK